MEMLHFLRKRPLSAVIRDSCFIAASVCVVVTPVQQRLGLWGAIVFTLGGVGASWVSRKQEPVLDLPRWFRRLFLAFAILDVGGFIAVLTMVLTTHFPGRGYLMAGFFYGSAGIAAVLYGVQLRLTRKK